MAYGVKIRLTDKLEFVEVKNVSRCIGCCKSFIFTPKDDYGIMYDTTGNEVAYFKYLSICKYDNGEGYYLFKCNEEYEVVSDSLWESIEMCMGVANTSYGGNILWIKK